MSVTQHPTHEQPAYYPQPNSHLLRLPGELLNKVVDHLLATDTTARVEPSSFLRIPHPITQTCKQLRSDYLEDFAWQPCQYVSRLTASTVDFDFSVLWMFSACDTAGSKQERRLKVKVTPSWLFKLRDTASAEALALALRPASTARVIYEIDLSGIKDPETVLGYLTWLNATSSCVDTESPWENLCKALRAVTVREMAKISGGCRCPRVQTDGFE